MLITFSILGTALVLFIWGRWRYDVVAFVALILGVIAGVVPFGDAYSGLGHPAVITVAAALVVSRGLQSSGLIDRLARGLTLFAKRPLLMVGALTVLAAFLSAFMNNVAALALLMPLALQSGLPPAQILMPISFGSILGGLTTLIGTPPNIIIGAYRAEAVGSPFELFDFAPVGVPIAIVGVLYITFVGWRLIPRERRGQKPPEDLFEIADYVAEVKVPKGSKTIGKSVEELEDLSEGEVTAVSLIRRKKRLRGTPRHEMLQEGDILSLEADPVDLDKLVKSAGLELAGKKKDDEDEPRAEDVALMEAVIPRGARIEGRTPTSLRLRSRYNSNLLAISREGKPFRTRLGKVKLRAGDVLLLQGESDTLADTVAALDALPLRERGLQLGKRREAFLPVAIFLGAIGVTAAGILPVHVAFGAAVAALVVFDVLSPREVYETIDWPVIILLASMIPLGQALEATGGTEWIAQSIARIGSQVHPVAVLAAVMIVTMTLSDLMNNAATAVIMAPIATSLAAALNVSPDPFLMATAIGASCAFLTPIGHQNNILVMGPGGYHFGDYWRMGLPLEILIVVLSLPLLVTVWPLERASSFM
jgi:di/tricarboxylate transporter